MDPLKAASFAGFVAAYEPPPEETEDHARHVARMRAASASSAQAAAGLLADLHAAGCTVSTVGQLREPGIGNGSAVPILLDWLPRVAHRPLEREIAKTLTEPWASKQALQPLIAQFTAIDPATDPEDGLRWIVGDAVGRICDDTVADHLIAIATDGRHGAARAMIVLGLGRMRKARERAVPVLLSLIEDSTVAYAAMEALGNLEVAAARAKIEPFTRNPDPWVRKKANQALAKLPSS